MNKLKRLLTLLLVTASLPLASSTAGSFEVGGGALYWRPSFDGFHYADFVVGGLDGTEFPVFVKPDYDWGYQVLASWSPACSGLRFEAHYWHFFGSSASQVEARPEAVLIPAWATLAGPVLNSACGKIHSKYDAVDLLGGVKAFCCHYLVEGHLLLGGRYFNLRQNEKALLTDTSDIVIPVSQSYSFEGAGPRIGLDISVTPWRCLRGLQFRGVFGTTLAIAKKHHRFNGLPGLIFPSDQIANEVFPGRTVFTAAIDGRLGVAYSLCLSCFEIRGELGWELHYYPDARERFVRGGGIAPGSRETSGIGYGGGYGNLSIAF